VSNYREKCLGCHASRSCPVSRSESHGANEPDCIGCHMAKARAYDGGHTVFTDHSIPRRPANDSSRKLAPDALASYFPADPASSTAVRNVGIAWAQVAENYAAPPLFDKAWPMLRAAAGHRTHDPLLYAKVGEALEAASKTTEAERLYRLSLEQDPQQPDVLLRLAALLGRSGKHTEAAELRKRAGVILPR
jgi:tetratricopeptide (TPR) repeat protein